MSVRAAIRAQSCSGVSWRARGAEAGTTTGRWRDKKAHGALRSVGCFCLGFPLIRQCAASARNVRSHFNALPDLAFAHIAGAGHG